MTKLTCADRNCERAPMRTRDGQRYCMWHPGQTAPAIDLLSGRLRGPDGKPKRDAPTSDIPRLLNEGQERAGRPGYRVPGRVRTPQPGGSDAPADGSCPADRCTRPYRHRGVHAVAAGTKPLATKVTPETEAAVHARAANLDQSVSEYLRSLIHADLTGGATA